MFIQIILSKLQDNLHIRDDDVGKSTAIKIFNIFLVLKFFMLITWSVSNYAGKTHIL